MFFMGVTDMLKSLKNHLEFRLFLKMMHQRYSQALEDGDHQAMMEAGGSLCLVYSSLGNHAYACKWADEFWRLWGQHQSQAVINPRAPLPGDGD
ncbi:MAG: hypothetical protein ABR497_00030 [Kiritimatiellia bacterium]|nr:hypothetical protein [Lentisphaerota bacterium]